MKLLYKEMSKFQLFGFYTVSTVQN